MKILSEHLLPQSRVREFSRSKSHSSLGTCRPDPPQESVCGCGSCLPDLAPTGFSILCFFPVCQILIDHRDLGLLLGSLFCSIGLCVCSYASTRLFWLQLPCNTVWYQVKIWNASWICVLSLHRGHAKVCIIPTLAHVLPNRALTFWHWVFESFLCSNRCVQQDIYKIIYI